MVRKLGGTPKHALLCIHTVRVGLKIIDMIVTGAQVVHFISKLTQQSSYMYIIIYYDVIPFLLLALYLPRIIGWVQDQKILGFPPTCKSAQCPTYPSNQASPKVKSARNYFGLISPSSYNVTTSCLAIAR